MPLKTPPPPPMATPSTREPVEGELEKAGKGWVSKLRLKQTRGLASALKKDPNLLSWVDPKGWTLVHWAAWAPCLPGLELLAKQGAALDQPNHGQETPLIVACRRGWPEPVAFLLDRGARATQTGLFGQSAIDLLACAFSKHHEGPASEALGVLHKLRAAGAQLMPTEPSVTSAQPAASSGVLHRNLVARVLGEGARMDLAELAQGLVEMGERPSEEDLAWAKDRGLSISVEKTRAVLDREVMRDAIESETASHTTSFSRSSSLMEPRVLEADAEAPSEVESSHSPTLYGARVRNRGSVLTIAPKIKRAHRL